MEICESTLKAHPQNKRLLVTYGQAAANAGYIDTAISQYEELLALDPKHVSSLRALGQLHGKAEDPQKAIEYFERVIELKPADEKALREAIESLQAMLDQDRQPPPRLPFP